MKPFDHLHKALERRAGLFEAENKKTNCFRLFCGKTEGIDGFVVDRYGSAAVLNVFLDKNSFDQRALHAIGEWYIQQLALKSVYLKYIPKDRSQTRTLTDLCPMTPIVGENTPDPLVVLENQLSYYVRLKQGLSTGLFNDQRENRKFLSTLCQKPKMLNLFSYTCSFSVACALQGGTTTNVDVSKKALLWGKENFRLNDISPEQHRFYPLDVFKFLDYAKKKQFSYDLIIIDAPSFGRSSRKTFSLQRDFEMLIEKVWSLVSQAGFLFFSCTRTPHGDNRVLTKALLDLPGARSFILPSPPVDHQLNEMGLQSILIKKFP